MHSSPTRILEGIAHQLHHVVLPALDDTYAQSQVRAAIELLGNLSTRVIVDPKALLDAVRADRALLEEVVAVAPDADELAWITQLLLAPVPDAEQPSAVEEAARALKSVTNENGSQVLLFNIHISSQRAMPILYPSDESQLPDPYSKLLFRMSSPLTDEMLQTANAKEIELELVPGARGFVFQADLVSVIQLLDIGTRAGSNI